LPPIPSFLDSSSRHFRVWHHRLSFKREHRSTDFENGHGELVTRQKMQFAPNAYREGLWPFSDSRIAPEGFPPSLGSSSATLEELFGFPPIACG
jgi:hypothetical protein